MGNINWKTDKGAISCMWTYTVCKSVT